MAYKDTVQNFILCDCIRLVQAERELWERTDMLVWAAGVGHSIRDGRAVVLGRSGETSLGGKQRVGGRVLHCLYWEGCGMVGTELGWAARSMNTVELMDG